jgi:hypothetical protein
MRTGEAVRRLGCAYWQLIGALRGGKLQPPAKDSAGQFVWTEEDLERARKALATDRRRKEHREDPDDAA